MFQFYNATLNEKSLYYLVILRTGAYIIYIDSVINFSNQLLKSPQMKEDDNKNLFQIGSSQSIKRQLQDLHIENSQQEIKQSKFNHKNVKKIISKREQNQGLIIIRQKQTKKMFQHLCDQDGRITMQSLGRAMVRTKKQFEMDDIKKMLNYLDVIKKKQPQLVQKLSIQNEQRNNLKQLQKVDQEVRGQNEEQSNFKDSYLSQNQFNQYSQGEFNQRQSLNFQDFRVIYSYFNK